MVIGILVALFLISAGTSYFFMDPLGARWRVPLVLGFFILLFLGIWILDISREYERSKSKELITKPFFLEERPKIVLKEEAFICDVCKQTIREDIANCPSCSTPYHYRCLAEWIKSGHQGSKCPHCKAELALK